MQIGWKRPSSAGGTGGTGAPGIVWEIHSAAFLFSRFRSTNLRVRTRRLRRAPGMSRPLPRPCSHPTAKTPGRAGHRALSTTPATTRRYPPILTSGTCDGRGLGRRVPAPRQLGPVEPLPGTKLPVASGCGWLRFQGKHFFLPPRAHSGFQPIASALQRWWILFGWLSGICWWGGTSLFAVNSWRLRGKIQTVLKESAKVLLCLEVKTILVNVFLVWLGQSCSCSMLIAGRAALLPAHIVTIERCLFLYQLLSVNIHIHDVIFITL